jgi:hypothetical protein
MTSLIFASNLCVKFANGRVYINGIERFWSYAKERLLKFHGVSKDNFIYYLKSLNLGITLGIILMIVYINV